MQEFSFFGYIYKVRKLGSQYFKVLSVFNVLLFRSKIGVSYNNTFTMSNHSELKAASTHVKS